MKLRQGVKESLKTLGIDIEIFLTRIEAKLDLYTNYNKLLPFKSSSS